MKKLILLLILSIFLVSLCYGEVQSLGLVRAGDCITLKQSYTNSSYVNISAVTYPNKTMISNEWKMTKNGMMFNYSFCYTNDLGQYIVDGHGDIDGYNTPFGYDFVVTPTGANINSVMISIYIFFLLLCLVIAYFSTRWIKTHPMKQDIKPMQMYALKKRNEFLFYVELLKKKLWIIGLFGLYLSILLFVSFLFQLTYDLGIKNLYNLLNSVVIVLLWGLIPFIIFWICYLIISFYLSIKDILKYQFGGIKE